jgi:hypothetical protein
VIVTARDIQGQRAAIEDVLGWDEVTYRSRRDILLEAFHRYQTWDAFRRAVREALEEVS